MLPRNFVAKWMSENPNRYRTRVVKPKKGKGRKNRPRERNWE